MRIGVFSGIATAIAVGAIVSGGGGGGGTCTTTLNSGANLAAAVSAAHGGDTICLNAGTYTSDDFSSISPSSTVTIRPSTGAAVTLSNSIQAFSTSNITVDGSTGLGGMMTVSGMSIDTADTVSPVSSNLKFDHVTWTDGIVAYMHGTGQNIEVGYGTFYDIGPQLFEGRFDVRGYPGSGAGDMLIQHNVFANLNGGSACSDGVGLAGNTFAVDVEYNEFYGLIEGSCAAHVDPIQDYGGGSHNIINGNWFHNNGDGSGGLEWPDGSDTATITNNVFNESENAGFGCVQLGSTSNTLIQHNLFIQCSWNTGDHKPGNPPSFGDVVEDNASTGPAAGFTAGDSPFTEDHNICSPAQSGCADATDINTSSSLVFVGGANPSTYCGYVLAPTSPGYHQGTGGSSMGIAPTGC